MSQLRTLCSVFTESGLTFKYARINKIAHTIASYSSCVVTNLCSKSLSVSAQYATASWFFLHVFGSFRIPPVYHRLRCRWKTTRFYVEVKVSFGSLARF